MSSNALGPPRAAFYFIVQSFRFNDLHVGAVAENVHHEFAVVQVGDAQFIAAVR